MQVRRKIPFSPQKPPIPEGKGEVEIKLNVKSSVYDDESTTFGRLGKRRNTQGTHNKTPPKTYAHVPHSCTVPAMIEHDNSLPMPPGTGLPADQAPEPPLSELMCVNGPSGSCKHLWQFQTNFRYGNPVGTFEEGKEPRHNRRFCLRGTSEMDLAGCAVYACNHYVGGGNELVQLRKGDA
jgi:hypothetical protein